MHYISTRGFGPVSFTRTLLEGLAPDGGLYVPEHYPHFSEEELEEFTFKSYEEIAERVMAPFVGDDIPTDVFRKMIEKAYQNFDDIEITPLLQYDQDMWLMELFHGPTYAFKDIAMQLLGLMLEWAYDQEGESANVIGATSGDTGPAAIAGLGGKENINVFMLFPHNRVSGIQRLQMTTSKHKNIFPIAIEGTFDDCQALVKEMFNDTEFRNKINATAVNSISWARLMPQMVYYFFAWSRLREMTQGKPLNFSVPTGNFGNIFSAYAAMQCGLPMDRLLIASNVNDILPRFINSGDYSTHKVMPTRSPSIDIQVSSNFERLLFDVYAHDAEKVKAAMQFFKESGALPALSDMEMDEIRGIFSASSVGEIDMLKVISEADATKHIVLDPHTAVGVAAAQANPNMRPIVSMATAHPIKFQNAVKEATGKEPMFTEELDEMLKADETFELLPNDVVEVKKFILANL